MMRKILGTLAGTLATHAVVVAPVLAQRDYDYLATSAAADASAAAGISLLITCCTFLFVAVIMIGIGYFVYRDAKKNNVDNAILWALLSAFTTWIGLLIYFLAIRPEAIRRNDAMGSATKKETKKEEVVE